MKPLYPSLIFPDTDIFSYKHFPYLLFGAPLRFLELVEHDPNDQRNDRDIFIDSGLCQPHAPSPLGEDRSRFLRLISDIKERKDDYAAQLSALTVAAMSSPKAETPNAYATMPTCNFVVTTASNLPMSAVVVQWFCFRTR